MQLSLTRLAQYISNTDTFSCSIWVVWNMLLKPSRYLERKIVLQRFYISSMMSRVEKMSLTPKGPTGLKSIWLQNFRDSGLSFPTHWSIFKESAQNIYQTSDGGRHDFWIINRLQYCYEKCQILSAKMHYEPKLGRCAVSFSSFSFIHPLNLFLLLNRAGLKEAANIIWLV